MFPRLYLVKTVLVAFAKNLFFKTFTETRRTVMLTELYSQSDSRSSYLSEVLDPPTNGLDTSENVCELRFCSGPLLVVLFTMQSRWK